ncbi:MAG: fructose bisphosphate aldolase [Gammaproteobacteria bacterium]
MINSLQAEQMSKKGGFIAALDQSGGSTPKALSLYGIDKSAYANDEEMFALMHQMRCRIISAPAFSGDRVIGAILFEMTMDGTIEGKPVPRYLWDDRTVVPILKIDKGLAEEADGVKLMKPMPDLDGLLSRAVEAGIFGTKERSVIERASESGIAAIVEQQFDVAATVLDHDLVPIIEPEVNINSPEKAACEEILKSEILKHLGRLTGGRKVMLKLTLPDTPGFYDPLIADDRVMRVVALSGGYSRSDANAKLAQNPGMIASFSRALTEGLSANQSDEAFNAALDAAIESIYRASIT